MCRPPHGAYDPSSLHSPSTHPLQIWRCIVVYHDTRFRLLVIGFGVLIFLASFSTLYRPWRALIPHLIFFSSHRFPMGHHRIGACSGRQQLDVLQSSLPLSKRISREHHLHQLSHRCPILVPSSQHIRRPWPQSRNHLHFFCLHDRRVCCYLLCLLSALHRPLCCPQPSSKCFLASPWHGSGEHLGSFVTDFGPKFSLDKKGPCTAPYYLPRRRRQGMDPLQSVRSNHDVCYIPHAPHSSLGQSNLPR